MIIKQLAEETPLLEEANGFFAKFRREPFFGRLSPLQFVFFVNLIKNCPFGLITFENSLTEFPKYDQTGDRVIYWRRVFVLFCEISMFTQILRVRD
jgi:hypothetical protein